MKKEKRKSKLIVRLMRPMLMLALLQFITFFTIWAIGGGFSYIKHYVYNTLVETTKKSSSFIQNELWEKVSAVEDAAEEINDFIAETLVQQGKSISAVQTDKELNRLIMESSVDSLVDLLRRSEANDVYLILDSGSLYGNDNDSEAKAALYLQDPDPTTDAEYEDLLMEVGDLSISQRFGIIPDSDWSLYFESDPEDMETFDFYYKTIQTAQENSSLAWENLGYWSGFSVPSRSSAASMRYTVPLIAKDGTVYGVLGIGLTENTVLANVPASDFTNSNACYVLGRSNIDNRFDIIAHSEDAFYWLVKNTKTLQVSGMLDENVYDFSTESEIDLAGSVQYINLYNQKSPYNEQRWALISIASRKSVLSPLTDLIRVLIVAAVISMLVSIFLMFLSSYDVVKPITAVINAMNIDQGYRQVIRFEPSNIYEIDKMTDAITQLQINVQDYSSQVSQMMRLADVGLGAFMYDHTDGSVFVGQSLIKFMQPHMQLGDDVVLDEDVVLDWQDFLENYVSEETRQIIIEGMKTGFDENPTDYTKEYSITKEDGSITWARLSLVHTKNKSIAVWQDITDSMMEKQRIEYERDYDNTTGLLNRRAYYRRVKELFRDTDALKITAFIMIDLDNLKYINDTYGHDFGDDYIKTAATALKKFQGYGGIVSRLSGDEFNVCLPGFSSKEEVRNIIKEVREFFLQSYCLLADGTRYKIRASAGISWYPDDAKDYEQLMKYADFAMYTIKHSTKGAVAEFDRKAYEMDAALLTSMEELNRIITESRVNYAFHSIVSVKTGQIYGYEALMRPQSTIFKSPQELLRAAKTGAKLHDIERITWTKVLADFQEQIDMGKISKDCRIFINSFPDSAMNPSDADILEAAYPNLLSHVVLEVLENEWMNGEYIARKTKRIKKWNAQMALDDFGTGFNSDYALLTLQPDIIRIDASIVSGCDKDASHHAIISNYVKLARTKQILVLAEGVETEAELKTVISCGVDLVQGFYFDEPQFDPQPLAPEITEMIQDLTEQLQS